MLKKFKTNELHFWTVLDIQTRVKNTIQFYQKKSDKPNLLIISSHTIIAIRSISIVTAVFTE